MSQAPNPFTQAASQGYGDFAHTVDDDDDEEETRVVDEEPQPDGPQSPEPEEREVNEHGFTQTQERSYPTGIDSPDDDDDDDDASNHIDIKEDEDDEDATEDANQSPQRRRVQIMNDSDNEDNDDDAQPPAVSADVVRKPTSRNFLKQFTMKNEGESPKKRRSDEHRDEKKAKRVRKDSNNDEEEQPEKETDDIPATSDVEDVVDDIFGKDVNDEEEEGDELAAELAELKEDEEAPRAEEEEETGRREASDGDDDDQGAARKSGDYSRKNDIMYDIDVFLEKKAEKRRGNRRRAARNGDIDLAGPDMDRIVKKLVDQMKIATEEDRIFNKNRQPATAKLLLLPIVEQQLCRADLTEIFLDNGVLGVFKDWLSPLPDKSLPNNKIRESLIKILQQFGVIHADPLRDSGIGKAIMYLYKHPRETKENKIKLIKIIHDWARPIFNLDTDYKHLTREERQQRDADQASLKRQTSLTGKPKNRSTDVDLPFANDRQNEDDDDPNNDDDCPRARVPRASNKDYLIRPVSAVEYSEKKSDGKKKTVSRLDEVRRRQQDRKRLAKPMSIVKLSIEGNKMHL